MQIDAGGGVIDVAVNLDTLLAIKDEPPIDAFAEGWHTDARLDYANTLGVHAQEFAAHSQSEIENLVKDALAQTNHISVYATGYASDGVHDVHKNNNFRDGAIVTKPTEGTAHYILFRFSDQSF